MESVILKRASKVLTPSNGWFMAETWLETRFLESHHTSGTSHYSVSFQLTLVFKKKKKVRRSPKKEHVLNTMKHWVLKTSVSKPLSPPFLHWLIIIRIYRARGILLPVSTASLDSDMVSLSQNLNREETENQLIYFPSKKIILNHPKST